MSVGMLNAELVVLNIADAHQWVRETEGANRGEVVDQIIRTTGLTPPVPWCAAFVAYVGRMALGEAWPLKPWAGCASLGEEAESKGLLRTTPTRGAVFLLWSERHRRYNHTGFVVGAAAAGKWKTVEGNTSPDGSPEGTGVFARLRAFNEKDRFIWWWV